MLAVDLGNLNNGYIEGAATEVINSNLAIASFLIETVGECCRRRLVDDAFDLQARDLACVLGGLPL